MLAIGSWWINANILQCSTTSIGSSGWNIYCRSCIEFIIIDIDNIIDITDILFDIFITNGNVDKNIECPKCKKALPKHIINKVIYNK